MPRLSIVLPDAEHQALCDLALREWREPREQAGWLIVQALQRASDEPADASIERVRQIAPAEAAR